MQICNGLSMELVGVQYVNQIFLDWERILMGYVE